MMMCESCVYKCRKMLTMHAVKRENRLQNNMYSVIPSTHTHMHTHALHEELAQGAADLSHSPAM